MSTKTQNRISFSTVTNIGVGAGGTHGAGSMDVVPNGLKQVYYKKTYDYEFPLRHPRHMVADVYYNKRFCRILSEGYPLVKAWRSIEGGWKSFWFSSPEAKKQKLARLPQTLKHILKIARG